MSYIKVSDTRFINPAHIVEFTYTPAGVELCKKKDKMDYDQSKTFEKPVCSTLKIVLTVKGDKLEFNDADADRIHAEITGTQKK